MTDTTLDRNAGTRLFATVLDQHPEQQHPRIAFCHGLFGQGKNWTTIGRQLADDYSIALVDMPNHGRSPWTGELSYPGMAELLADFLEDPSTGSGHRPSQSSGDVRPWTLVGHSMGGKIAMMVALMRPELVERLVVVDIAPVDYGGRGEFDQYVAAMQNLDLTAVSSRQAADDQLADGVPDPTIRSFLLQNLRRSERPGPGWRWQMNLQLLGDRLDVLNGFPELRTAPFDGPTLWVAGENSDYIRPEYLPAMKRLFPQVRKVKIKNAGHWVHSEQPAIFVDVLRAFLSSDRGVITSG